MFKLKKELLLNLPEFYKNFWKTPWSDLNFDIYVNIYKYDQLKPNSESSTADTT